MNSLIQKIKKKTKISRKIYCFCSFFLYTILTGYFPANSEGHYECLKLVFYICKNLNILKTSDLPPFQQNTSIWLHGITYKKSVRFQIENLEIKALEIKNQS